MENQCVNGVSLILEGGTFRTIYTAGVLDALMEEGIKMPYIVGISAGAISAVSYASQQPERTFQVFKTYRNDPRYMGFRNFLKEKSIFGLDFAYNKIPNELIPFDWETFQKYEGQIEFGVTNARTGKVEYKNAFDMDRECQLLRATCAIPVAFPEIFLDGDPYYDGGLTDPIPVARAEEMGYEKHLMVLTRPIGYEKKLSTASKIGSKLFAKKYPNLIDTFKNRPANYNRSLQRCNELEAQGKAFIFKPPHALKSFESKEERFTISYQLGYREAKGRMTELKAFLGLTP